MMRHEAELALGDLAYLMMSFSDNAATDAIIARVGLDRINVTLQALGLERTVVTGDCAHLIHAMVTDAGLGSLEEFNARAGEPEVIRRLAASRALDPATATMSTPRGHQAAGRDLAGRGWSAAGPRGMAWLLAWQYNEGRIVGAFPLPPPWVGVKSGSLPGWCNEAGVVDYLDGRRYAVAVFTRGRREAGRIRTRIWVGPIRVCSSRAITASSAACS